MAETDTLPPHWKLGPADVWLYPHRLRERGEPTARLALAQALGQRPDALPIERDERGRPHLLAPFHSHDLGWSHSGDALLVALGQSAQVGVDLEKMRPRPRAMILAERFFHPEELRWLQGLPDQAREPAFVRLWCAKEAVLKAHGHGLSFGLDRLCFAEQDGALHLSHCDRRLGPASDWTLHEWSPLTDYRAALAWRPG